MPCCRRCAGSRAGKATLQAAVDKPACAMLCLLSASVLGCVLWQGTQWESRYGCSAVRGCTALVGVLAWTSRCLVGPAALLHSGTGLNTHHEAAAQRCKARAGVQDLLKTALRPPQNCAGRRGACVLCGSLCCWPVPVHQHSEYDTEYTSNYKSGLCPHSVRGLSQLYHALLCLNLSFVSDVSWTFSNRGLLLCWVLCHCCLS